MKVLPWSSCRILLEGEPPEQDGIPLGIVGRLYLANAAPEALKHAFNAFQIRRVSLLAIGVQQVVNGKGPDALIGSIPGNSPHSIRLRELAESCYNNKQCLVSGSDRGDIVLIPRSQSVVEEDGFDFLVFVTNIKAADVCDLLRHQHKALVVLDLDNTLVDAMAVAVTQKDWDALHWQPCQVTTESGMEVAAQYAVLMEHDPLADAVYIMHWRMGKLCCTFKVRIRRGWERLREFFVRERSRFEVFVCSKGKQEYVQLLWHMLDPLSQLFPRTDWDWRLNSTFPDTVPKALPKTMLTALGCAHPLDDMPHMQLACPSMCLDDCPKAYMEHYHSNVLFVEEYRPSDLFTSDTGSVLLQAEHRLERYWAASYAEAACPDNAGDQGSRAAGIPSPWDKAVDGVLRLMQEWLGQPMQYPKSLEEQGLRCAALAAWLQDCCSVQGVFGKSASISDLPVGMLALVDSKAAPATVALGMEMSEVQSGLPGVEVEHTGGAAAAAEGAESPCSPLQQPPSPTAAGTPSSRAVPGKGLPVTPALVNGKRQYVTAESLLCALCAPSGACLPGCPACAELASAGGGQHQADLSLSDLPGAGDPARDGAHDDDTKYYMPIPTDASDAADRPLDDALSTPGWISSACSTPRSDAMGGSLFGAPSDAGGWGTREGWHQGSPLPATRWEHEGDHNGQSQQSDEEEREAAESEAFTSVDPSLQGMGREVFHMKLARISGHAMLMVPNARSLSGRLPIEGGGSLSLSSSPAKWEGVASRRSPPPLSSSPG